MGFDLGDLHRAVAAHGRVARVVIAGIKGSSPREVGAAMLVWDSGQMGTIGGGALEYQAAAAARDALASGYDRLSQHALGPDLGQCCGGRVTLWREVYDADRVAGLRGQEVIARSTDGSERPLAVSRLLAQARGTGIAPDPQLIQGWMIEPVHRPTRAVWIWGAGHVGRALVSVLAPLPDIALTWVDTGADRFPDPVPDGVTAIPAAQPETLMAHAPRDAHHLILTYSHTLDLALCHAALNRGFDRAGLIGSATKWGRFRKRLTELGHSAQSIGRIDCPIGDPTLGKHPQAIAVGVAATLLTTKAGHTAQQGDMSA
ncbi:xanthine dehydrogenase accessory protein XdhC [Thalassovita gelatinovora]|uniref:Xanthine dehydrogenase accessory protein XdhC n=1 Tax=Thalassovita gelatinovora TaxID=53501 RepID=A0A0P1FIM0_THAGE|nr:xanthine dehydrogenase accessory protein XdhC [Thalassovita gelatinovora]QIZ82207.1 xanthine dehydrogenase accessory protein XdhC [Thalassovita gelatinovora]CUH67836.1 xanthine dehydrogenase accessory protein XdhC [Thalassovita gelatinovora]SEP66153.1 molybdenum cofactor sulfurylase [Thalassovita gelatinovora]